MAALLLAVAPACSNDTKPRAGGETHWLSACVANDDCGDENLTCVCGTCTRACSASNGCAVAGEPAAACFDTQSPLLLQRCEDRAGELTGGICLLDCEAGATCGAGRACDEGACVPVSGDAGSSAGQSGGTAGPAAGQSGGGGSVSIDDFADVSDSVQWDMPIQSPPLSAAITGGDARILGTWLQVGCDPALPGSPGGCVRLDVIRSATGEVAGTLQLVNTRTPNMFGPLPPVEDADVGYPTADPRAYLQLTNLTPGVPYRILDGRLDDDRFTFVWSPFDLWHEWCTLQTPHRWSVGDHAFSFCVPQDREQWTAIDEGKIVLCTSADFEPLCSLASGDLGPCPCTTNPIDARCSPNFCQCDDSRCDANVRFIQLHTELSLEGDVLTGAFSGGGERWSGSLGRVRP